MSSSTISNVGLQLQSLANLQSQQTNLATLNEQIASGQLHSNLTDYDPTTAHNLMNFQNSVAQNQAYIAGMQTVTPRLSLYDQTMTDMEGIAANAQELASSNQALDQTTVAQIQGQAQNYLKQLTDDLNQQIGGRYIYAGTRYTTPPVTDLTTVTTTPSIPFTATTSPALPNYDSQYTSITLNSLPSASGVFQAGNSSISWSDLEAGSVRNVDVNGTSTAVTVSGLSAASTPAEAAANLQSTINQISSQIADFSGLSATVNGATVSLAATAVAQNPSVTVNSAPTGVFQVGNSSIKWSDLEAGTVTHVTVNGVSTAVTVNGLTSPATTPAQIAANLKSTINQLSAPPAQISDFSGLTASISSATVSLYATPNSPPITADAGGTASETSWSSGTPGTPVTPDSGGTASDISWLNGTDGTTAQNLSSSAGAYTTDSVAIDSSTSIQYGATSTNPAIQQLIAGLQFMSAATQTGVSATTYATDMQQAATLLTTALSGIQTLHSGVASAGNILANETSTQNADITNLQNQLSNLQSVDLTQVGTEINLLQTQLEASYSATASVEQLSILKYL